MTYATDGKVGVPDLAATSTPNQKLGTTVAADSNNLLIYVYADEALGSGTGVKINAAFTASVSAGAATTAIYAFAAGQYGWVKQAHGTLNTA